MFKVGDTVKLNKQKCSVSLWNYWYEMRKYHAISDYVATVISVSPSGEFLYFDNEDFCPGGWHYSWFIKVDRKIKLIRHKRIK